MAKGQETYAVECMARHSHLGPTPAKRARMMPVQSTLTISRAATVPRPT